MLVHWAEIDQEVTSHGATREYMKWMAENIRPRKSGLKRRRLTAPPPQLETTVDTNNTDKDVRPDRPFLLRRRQGPRRAPPGEIQNARRTPRLDPKRLPLHAERVSMYFHDDVTAR